MPFKVLKVAEKAPENSEYIQRKQDAAKAKGFLYELTDEDNRIDALHKREDLVVTQSLNSIDRVSTQNGEFLVLSVNNKFQTVDGVDVDRYVDPEGLTEEPITKIDDRTGQEVVVPGQNKLIYTIPYSPEKLNEIVGKYKNPKQFRWYEGGLTTARTIVGYIYECKNADYFKNASLEELQLGREKKYTSSRIKNLNKLRREINSDDIVAETPVTKQTPVPTTQFATIPKRPQTDNTANAATVANNGKSEKENEDVTIPAHVKDLPVSKK